MKKIAIIGSGHLGQQILHYIHNDSKDKVIGFFDDFQPKGTIVKEIPVMGGVSDILIEFENQSFDELLVAIGYKHMDFRKQVFEELKAKIPFHTFIHSSTYVDSTAEIGQGTVIYPGCLIDQKVKIGENVLMNVSGTVAHDSIIGNHSFLSPAVAIAGFVEVGEQCIIGINSTVIDNISIAPKTQMGGGSVVINNIEKSGLYVGNPVRFIR